MAGRKKSGDLGRPIGVRLDRPIDEQVREIAEKSAVVQNDVSVVIRVLVTAYFMQSEEPIKEFDDVAMMVNAWRKKYAAGVAVAIEQAGDHEVGRGKKPKRPKPSNK